MRIPGFCTECHRVKQVSVSGHALAMAGARGGVVRGICAACENATTVETISRDGGRLDRYIVRDRQGRQVFPRQRGKGETLAACEDYQRRHR